MKGWDTLLRCVDICVYLNKCTLGSFCYEFSEGNGQRTCILVFTIISLLDFSKQSQYLIKNYLFIYFFSFWCLIVHYLDMRVWDVYTVPGFSGQKLRHSLFLCLIFCFDLRDWLSSWIIHWILFRKIMQWKDPEISLLSLQKVEVSLLVLFYYDNNNWL